MSDRYTNRITVKTKNFSFYFAVCVAVFFGALLSSPAVVAMEFSLPKHELYDSFEWINSQGNLTRIYASGPIDSNAARDLEDIVRTHRIQTGIVLFNSPGGSVIDAIELGQAIRRLGLSTGIASFVDGKMISEGVCASACAYAFAGGNHRYYYGGQTRLGLHQFYSKENEISNRTSQEVSGLLVAYLHAMGVDALAFSVSSMAAPDTMAWLTPEDAARLRFATNGSQETISELKLQDGVTYLKIEQEHSRITGRIIFSCINKQLSLLGGYVSNPEEAKNKLDWATRSALILDGKTFREERKGASPKGIVAAGSVLWVTRALSRSESYLFVNGKSIGVMIGSDGFLTYEVSVSLNSAAKDKLLNFAKNCFQ